MALKYVFMGSPALAATILERLLRDLPLPALVVTQPPRAQGRGQKLTPTAVEDLARRHGLPVLATENVSQESAVTQLRELKPDLILVAAFGQILRESVLSLPRLFCLNVHASLLPKYRGAGPAQWAIWKGETETGVTIQRMVKKLDAGDILLQKKIAIGPEENSGQLLLRLADLGAEALVESVRLVESGKYAFAPQNEAAATLAPKIEKHQAVINWQQSAQEVLNQVRALQPWPVAETKLGGARLQIYQASLSPTPGVAKPGSLRSDGKSFLEVCCGDGRALFLTEIQPENRKRLGIKEFLQAFRGNFPHAIVPS